MNKSIFLFLLVANIHFALSTCVLNQIDSCWQTNTSDTAVWQMCGTCSGIWTCVPIDRLTNPYSICSICVPSPSPSPSTTPSVSITPSTSSTPSVTASPTSSVTPTPLRTPSVTPSTSPSITPSVSPTPSVTPTASVTPTTSRTPSLSPSSTPSKSMSPSISTSSSPSVTPSATPSVTPTSSVTPSGTPSASMSPSVGSSPSVSPSSATASATSSPDAGTTGGSTSKKNDSSVAIGAAVGAVGGAALLGLAALLVVKKRRSKRNVELHLSMELEPQEKDEDKTGVTGYGPLPGPDRSSGKPYSEPPQPEESDSDSSSEEESESSASEVEEVNNNKKGSLVRPKKIKRPSSTVLDIGIAAEDIVEGRLLGEGQFGLVYQGIWRNATVVIKKIKLENEQARREFLEEAQLIKKIRPHPNVVQFFGVCEAPLMIINEFLNGGSLDKYLDDKSKPLSMDTVIEIIKGIASGMYHLSEETIVHRDLAARNVLLTSTLTPKINDFGLSRLLQKNEEYLSNAQSLPLKWLAPESMQMSDQVYSEKSDVWSFGVTCIEILTRDRPYPTMDATEVVYLTRAGQLKPTIPETCPEILRTILEMCFEFDPSRRPTFKVICKMLESL